MWHVRRDHTANVRGVFALDVGWRQAALCVYWALLVLEGGMLPILYGSILHHVWCGIFRGPFDDGFVILRAQIFIRMVVSGLKFTGLLTEVPTNFFFGVLHLENRILEGEEAAMLVLVGKRLIGIALVELFQNIVIVLSVQTF